ncbi:hypothetical protein SD81_030470 [Tolypothrix campylonemoides VB511288]|nr:hypothetical protein SD81_030470 [Tolypothrix campylonemoides VB511288]
MQGRASAIHQSFPTHQATGESSPVRVASPPGEGGFPNLGNWRKRKAHAKGERAASPFAVRRAEGIGDTRRALVFLRVQTQRKASREEYEASLSNNSAFIYEDVF